MQNWKTTLFYVVTIGGFSALMYRIILSGAGLEQGRNIAAIAAGEESSFIAELLVNIKSPLALLLAQLITIVLVARLFGWICVKLKQPSVIGEMFAGIVLGPSLFGLYFPEFFGALFPAESLGNIKFLSQIGLILFMYIIGMELDLKVLKTKVHEAVVVSHASIIIPFTLGVGLAYFLYVQFAPANIPFTSFALFSGIAMSITAFPVLARIVQERGLQKTRLGTVVITCAAADDVTAWCILAAVIAIVKAGSVVHTLYIILLSLAYIFMMIKIVRPFLNRVSELYSTKERLSKSIIALFFLTLIVSAYTTEIIGIHALFGAFMAGAIMPENIRFRTLIIEKIEDVALVLLLPLFFVFTGLRTEIGLLNDPNLWAITGLIILVAVTGKFAGSALAARFVGQNWKSSLSIGALMNTRGLMELIVLNIGYDLGVLSPQLFSMFVIMALLTTFMTGPALDIINKIFGADEEDLPQEIKADSKYKILFSFVQPEYGKSLLKLANSLTKKMQDNTVLTALHISPVNELPNYDVERYEKKSFGLVEKEAATLNQKITTLFKASSDVDNEIVNVVNKGDYDLLLIAEGLSLYEGSLLGKILGFTTRFINPEKLINTIAGKDDIFDGQVKHLLEKLQSPVGVLVDKNFIKAEKIFIPLFDVSDAYLIAYAQKLIHNAGAQVVVLDAAGQIKNNAETKEKIRAIEQTAPNHITLQNQRAIEKEFLQQQDLMLISLNSWKKMVESKSLWLADIPSALIISDKM